MTALSNEDPVQELKAVLSEHLPWHGARIGFLAQFLLALLKVRSVSLAERATGFGGKAQVDSHYKRLQRFFRSFEIGYDDLARLPPAFVLTAGYDPLRDEGLQYSQRLSEAGARATHVCFERQIHGFITMGRVIAEANTALALCASSLKSNLRAGA